jgi:hypothetical protein
MRGQQKQAAVFMPRHRPRLRLKELIDEGWGEQYYLDRENLVIPQIDPFVEISPGRIDSEAISWFKWGHCALLALDVHAKTGWPLVIVRTDMKTDNGTAMIHTLVRTPDNKLLDIEGPHHQEEIIDYYRGRKYKDAYLETHSKESLIDLLEPEKGYYGRWERALADDFAALVIKESYPQQKLIEAQADLP